MALDILGAEFVELWAQLVSVAAAIARKINECRIMFMWSNVQSSGTRDQMT